MQEEALRLVAGVQGVVQLSGTAASPDGRHWLVMQPCGALMDLAAPPAAKLGAARGLARVIGRLASADCLHCDISHYNVLTVKGGSEVLLVDFGSSRRLIPPARLDDIDDSAQARYFLPPLLQCSGPRCIMDAATLHAWELHKPGTCS